MPGTTPILGLPYPEGTDPVREGDNVIKALAESVEVEIDKRARGLLTYVQAPADSGGIGDGTYSCPPVTLPAGRRVRLTVSFTYSPPTPGTGMVVDFQRGAEIVASYWTMTSTPDTGVTFVALDLAPPAGETVYSVRFRGHGANGNIIRAGLQLMAEDVGAAAGTE